MYTGQQDKAKNAIVKANSATVHTIIQGNLADTSFSDAADAVNSIPLPTDPTTYVTGGSSNNGENPSGMKNPHNTDGAGIVVKAETATNGSIVNDDGDKGEVVVKATGSANQFYIIGFDQDGNTLGEQYTATK